MARSGPNESCRRGFSSAPVGVLARSHWPPEPFKQPGGRALLVTIIGRSAELQVLTFANRRTNGRRPDGRFEADNELPKLIIGAGELNEIA